MAIKFICPQCGNEIISEFLRIGEKTNCPKCGKAVIIPEDAVQTVTKPTNEEMLNPEEQDTLYRENNSVSSKRLNILVAAAKYTGGFLFIYFFYSIAKYFISVDTPGWVDVILSGLSTIAIYFAFFILIFILTEVVKIFIAIEKNTRSIHILLEKQLKNGKDKE